MTKEHSSHVAGEAATPRWRLPVNDMAIGMIAGALGLYMIVSGLDMPRLNQQGQLGTGLFPVVIGGALASLGLALLGSAVLRGRPGAVQPDVADATPRSPLGDADEGDGRDESILMEVEDEPRWRLLVNGATVLAGVGFYLGVSGTLGYLVTMFIVMTAIQLVLRGRLLTTLLVSAGVTLLLWAVFDLLLLVQLPTGPWGF